MRKRVVIVGGGAAGVSAAIAARKTNRKAEITVVEQGKFLFYERGGIPFVIGGEVPSFEALVSFPPKFYDMMKIEMLMEAEATSVDSSSKEVTVADKDGGELLIGYDSLILATGADSFIIPVPGHTLLGVYGIRTPDDGREILGNCETAESAVVVGARLVGLEMAVALRRRGLAVTVIELLPQILEGILDKELADEVQKRLEGAGIRFILGNGISDILGKDYVEAVRAGPHEAKADMVIMATGVRGRTELAQRIGLRLGETRLIKVDERLETNVKGVFAAGDCIECVSAITGTPTVSQLGANAMRQGKAAGTNAAGGFMTYPKVLGACVAMLHETEIASTGLTESYAKKFGIECVSASAEVSSRPKFYPKRLPVRVKLVANKIDSKIIGAQIISKKEAGTRIDTISVAIMKGATVDDLILFDHAYSPPLAESPDPLSAVAEILSRKRAVVRT